MKKLICTALFALALGVGQVQAAEITWTGCGITKNAFMEEIANGYSKKTGDTIKLSGGGATKGIRATAAGTSDLGGSCRHRITSKDGQVLPEEGDATLVQVAWDALVAVVHPENPVSDISLDNLKKVYDGEITNWKDLGGLDQRIILVTRESKNSGVGYMFRGLVYEDTDYEFKGRSLKEKSTGPLEKKIEKTPAAFGMDGVSSAKRKDLKILSINGVEPSKENIATGAYPLFRPLYLSHNKEASPQAKAVIDYVLSEEGQKIISEQGTVNLTEGKALEETWKAKKKNLGL